MIPMSTGHTLELALCFSILPQDIPAEITYLTGVVQACKCSGLLSQRKEVRGWWFLSIFRCLDIRLILFFQHRIPYEPTGSSESSQFPCDQLLTGEQSASNPSVLETSILFRLLPQRAWYQSK